MNSRHVITAGDLYLAGAQTAAVGLGPQGCHTPRGQSVFEPQSRAARQAGRPIICAALCRWHWPLIRQRCQSLAHGSLEMSHNLAGFRRSVQPPARSRKSQLKTRSLHPAILQHRMVPAPCAVRNRRSLPDCPAPKTGQHRHSLDSALQNRPAILGRSRILFSQNRNATQGPVPSKMKWALPLRSFRRKFRFLIAHVALPSCRCILWGSKGMSDGWR